MPINKNKEPKYKTYPDTKSNVYQGIFIGAAIGVSAVYFILNYIIE